MVQPSRRTRKPTRAATRRTTHVTTARYSPKRSRSTARTRRVVTARTKNVQVLGQSRAKRPHRGQQMQYEWAMYHLPVERHSSGVAHKYKRIAGGRTTSNFLPGSIAREAFGKVLGHGSGEGAYMAYLVVVANETTGGLHGYFGSKRNYAGAKPYWGVNQVYSGPGRSLKGVQFSRLHGKVSASHGS